MPATVVNLSPHGLMARVDHPIAVGEWIAVVLPIAGVVGAVVRWSLGGRIGCQLEHEIDARDYPALLAAAADQHGASTATPAATLPLVHRSH